MRFRAAKWIAMSVVSTVAFASASIATQADACCGFFSALFGCGGCGPRCCRPAYPSCAPSGCSTGSYYGPVVYNNCAPCATGCSPCGTGGCSTGNCATGNCTTGNCDTGNCTVGSTVGSSLSPPAPDPDPNFKAKQRTGTPRTFENGADSDLGTSGTLPRTGSDNGTDDGASRLNDRDGNIGFKSPKNSDGAEANEADADTGSKTGTGAQKKKSPGVPRAKDEEDGTNGARRAPTIISVDEKVAWRAAPVRTRVGAKTQTASARLVRLPAYPKSDWLPVDGDSKIAKN